MSEKRDELLEVLTDFATAVESACVNLKRYILDLLNREDMEKKRWEIGKKWSWDPNGIAWFEAKGASGKYERSEDVNNPQFKEMLKDLAAHGGKLKREGYFYWVFKNGSVVGRKHKNNCQNR